MIEWNKVCLVCAVLQVAVPTLLQLWLPQLLQHRDQLSLRQLVSSGEGLTAALAQDLLGALPPGCSLVNLYGEFGKVVHC
jgi:non-ribosomal peptide synthetase component F